MYQGSKRDAVLYAVGANATHGLRRTSADKRRAVEMVLADPEWVAWSNRQIADQCRVDEKTVRAIRDEMERRAEIPHVEKRTDSKGRQQPATKPRPEKPARVVPPGQPEGGETVEDVRMSSSVRAPGELAPVAGVGRMAGSVSGVSTIVDTRSGWPSSRIVSACRSYAAPAS